MSKLEIKRWRKIIVQMGDPICKGCGEGIEIAEHALLSCRQAKQVWEVAPIQWDGAREQQGCFKAWSNEILGVRHRHSGANHLALIVNILWQVWKNRNELEFNNKKRQSVQIVQNTHEKWIKYSDAHRQGETTSTE